MYDNGQIVCTGIWNYNNNIKTGVAIQKMSIIFGSGDYDDSPEIRDDREIDNYYIWFATAGSLIDFKNGAGYKFNLDEAKIEAERLVGQKIAWTEDDSEVKILLSDDSNENKFDSILDILTNRLGVVITNKLTGLDQKYWDFKFKDVSFTLHSEHYLGIMIFPNDKVSKGRYLNSFRIRNKKIPTIKELELSNPLIPSALKHFSLTLSHESTPFCNLKEF